MSFLATDLIASAQSLVREKGEILVESDWAMCLANALDFHSRYRKNILVVAVTATGSDLSTGDRVYPLPTGWEVGFSEAGFGIEYPVDTEAAWPTMLRPTMFQIYDVPVSNTFPQGKSIRFRETYVVNGASDRRPTPGTVFRLHFQVRWIVSDVRGVTTAWDSDFWPLVFLVASTACFMIASQMARSVDSTMQADSANYRDKDDKFTKLGVKYQAEYKSRIMPPAEDLKAFGLLGEFEQDDFNRTPYSPMWRDESGLLNSDR